MLPPVFAAYQALSMRTIEKPLAFKPKPDTAN
jgi:hypothetical protein